MLFTCEWFAWKFGKIESCDMPAHNFLVPNLALQIREFFHSSGLNPHRSATKVLKTEAIKHWNKEWICVSDNILPLSRFLFYSLHSGWSQQMCRQLQSCTETMGKGTFMEKSRTSSQICGNYEGPKDNYCRVSCQGSCKMHERCYGWSETSHFPIPNVGMFFLVNM